jgi:hypothetical protein
MGGAHTKLEQNEDAFDTPPRQSSRVLNFDPRSPSTEITRTPIMVDKTPEGILDPRSPTVGVYRTPIVDFNGTCRNINETCLNQTFLGSVFVFRIDRCLAYAG